MSSPATELKVGLNARIVHLALPTVGVLAIEPLCLLTDTAIVGHLGTGSLAGVAVASTLLQAAVGLLVFLAYATTPEVARLRALGRHGEALALGRDGLWLAAFLGCFLAILGGVGSFFLLDALRLDAQVRDAALQYLLWSLLGLPAVLGVFAAAGLFRGLQAVRVTLWISCLGCLLNAGLNWLLVYPGGCGVAGAAIGTDIAQWIMATVYVALVAGRLSQFGQRLWLSWKNIRGLTSLGSWLFLRTVSLRAGILLVLAAAANQGQVNLAAHQIVMTLYVLLTFVPDALAIAAQVLMGQLRGDSRGASAQFLVRRVVFWGVGCGAFIALAMLVALPWLAWIFSRDPEVHEALLPALWVLSLSQPLAGYVFVLDGVLMGAGDTRYLALAGVICLVLYLPLVVFLIQAHVQGPEALGWLWGTFVGGYMALRAVSLGARTLSQRWLRDMA